MNRAVMAVSSYYYRTSIQRLGSVGGSTRIGTKQQQRSVVGNVVLYGAGMVAAASGAAVVLHVVSTHECNDTTTTTIDQPSSSTTTTKDAATTAPLTPFFLSSLSTTKTTLPNGYIAHCDDSRQPFTNKDYSLSSFPSSSLPSKSISTTTTTTPIPTVFSWIRRRILVPIGIMSLPLPRIIESKDPSLTLPSKAVRQRQRDEQAVLQLLQREGPILQQLQLQQQQQQQTNGSGGGGSSTSNSNNVVLEQKFKEVTDQIFQLTYGKHVTPQLREDFLLRYGCTGWTTQVIQTLLDLASHRGIVEIGAGHGQWSRALNEAYYNNDDDDDDNDDAVSRNNKKTKNKTFDFVLAYDDNSNLPLNTHIYNQYTQPHRDYFGDVRVLQSSSSSSSSSNANINAALTKVLGSWQCRGRVLLLVYPPPGPMAKQVVETYINVAPENDTVVFVGEGRGGANADDAFFDMLLGSNENDGNWMLLDVVDVLKPPGNKGYEKMFILQKIKK